MSHDGLNRRAFLRNAGMTALAGAVGSGTSFAGPLAVAGAGLAAANGTFDFDTPYNRFGTDSTKYDQQIRVFGKDSVQVGMGIAHPEHHVRAPASSSPERSSGLLGSGRYSAPPPSGASTRADSGGRKNPCVAR